MMCEVSDPNGVVLPVEHVCVVFSDYAIHQHSTCHMHIHQYVLPEQLFWRVAENCLDTGTLSACGVLGTLSKNLKPWFLVVLNLLHLNTVCSVSIRKKTIDTSGFLGELLVSMMVCEVNDPNGVVLVLEDLCCSFGTMQFTNTLRSLDSHTVCCARRVVFNSSWIWLGCWTSLWVWGS